MLPGDASPAGDARRPGGPLPEPGSEPLPDPLCDLLPDPLLAGLPGDPDAARAVAEAVEEALAGGLPPVLPTDPYRLLASDPHDFAGLYIRHRSSFGLHARRFLRDPRDVDEVVQEAFLRLFLALPELETELQALAYCRRTITNLCIDRYRADQRRPRLVDLASVPPDALPDDELDDPVVQAEDAAVVREALSLLTPLHREALVKREIEEKPLPQIAVELDVPEESVKHLLHRARRALRRRLAETHLAPGADLDTTSTLALLARSAAAGAGRTAVLVVVLAGVAVGLGDRVPGQALTALRGGHLPDRATVVPQVDEGSAVSASPPSPVVLDGPFGPIDRPGPITAPAVEPAVPVTAAPDVAAVAVPAPASPTVTTSPAVPVGTGPSPGPAPSGPVVVPAPAPFPADAVPSATPAPVASPSAEATPRATPTASGAPGATPEPSAGPSSSSEPARADASTTDTPPEPLQGGPVRRVAPLPSR